MHSIILSEISDQWKDRLKTAGKVAGGAAALGAAGYGAYRGVESETGQKFIKNTGEWASEKGNAIKKFFKGEGDTYKDSRDNASASFNVNKNSDNTDESRMGNLFKKSKNVADDDVAMQLRNTASVSRDLARKELDAQEKMHKMSSDKDRSWSRTPKNNIRHNDVSSSASPDRQQELRIRRLAEKL